MQKNVNFVEIFLAPCIEHLISVKINRSHPNCFDYEKFIIHYYTAVSEEFHSHSHFIVINEKTPSRTC